MIHRVENGDFRKRSLSKKEGPRPPPRSAAPHSAAPWRDALDRRRDGPAGAVGAFVDDFGALAGTKHDDRAVNAAAACFSNASNRQRSRSASRRRLGEDLRRRPAQPGNLSRKTGQK